MNRTGSHRYSVFISSVQKELAEERRAVKDFITHDPLFNRFIRDVFLFEDIPAGDQKPDDIYLDEVARCDIYLAILGNRYGWKNQVGKSPTELEFDEATRTHRERLVFVKGSDDKAREPEMAKLVRRAGIELTRRRFSDTPGLIREVYSSLVESLENRGALITTPFDGSICGGASLRDVDNRAVADFVETGEAAGRLRLKLKAKGKITSGEYREHTGIEARTATRDLHALVKKGVLIRYGEKRGTYYTLRKGNRHLRLQPELELSDIYRTYGTFFRQTAQRPIEFPGLWEQLNNPKFYPIEFDGI